VNEFKLRKSSPYRKTNSAKFEKGVRTKMRWYNTNNTYTHIYIYL